MLSKITALNLLIIFVFGAFLLVSALFFFQRKIILHPKFLEKNHQYTFAGQWEELNFSPEKNIKLNAILFKTQLKSKGIVFYSHGNADNLERWGVYAADFTQLGYDVLMYDYRGFGKSNGVFEEKDVLSDANFIFQELTKSYAKENIVVFGRSLGTGIATYVAANNDCKALVLETPYYNLPDVGRLHFRFLPYDLITKFRFPTNEWIKNVKAPITLVHGTADEIIPYEASQKLMAELANKNAKLTTIKGGMHKNLSDFKAYHTCLSEVLE
jgi:uncharacterized protein